MLWYSVCFGDAVLLVVGLPVSPLTVFATIRHETTPSTGQELESTSTSFWRGTVATDTAIGCRILLAFRLL